MSFLICALAIDCLTNGKNDSNDGAGLIGILVVLGYVLIKLESIGNYILRICAGKENILFLFVISFSFLIPIYWSVMKDKNSSFFVGILLRLMIYINIFAGIAIMVIVSNKLDMPIASYLFGIDKLELLSNSKEFFKSLVGTILYLLVRFMDIASTIILIPVIQLAAYSILKKIKELLLN